MDLATNEDPTLVHSIKGHKDTVLSLSFDPSL